MTRPIARYKPVREDQGMRRLLQLRDDLRIGIARLEGKLDGIETAIALSNPSPDGTEPTP